jgi:hypothetical protein
VLHPLRLLRPQLFEHFPDGGDVLYGVGGEEVLEDAGEPGDVVVEVVLGLNFFGEACDFEGVADHGQFCVGEDFVFVGFVDEVHGFFDGDVEAHVDAGLFVRVLHLPSLNLFYVLHKNIGWV